MSTFIAENFYNSFCSSITFGPKVIGENLKLTAKSALILKNPVTSLTILNPFKSSPAAPNSVSISSPTSIGNMKKNLFKNIINFFDDVEEFETPGFKKMFSNFENEKGKATSFSIRIGPTGVDFAWTSVTGSGSIQMGTFKKMFGKTSAAPKAYKLFVPKFGLDISILHACSNSEGYIGIKVEDELCRSVDWWFSLIINLAKIILKSCETPSVQPGFGRIGFGEFFDIFGIVDLSIIAEGLFFHAKPIGKVINDASVKPDILFPIPEFLKHLPILPLGSSISIHYTYFENSYTEKIEEIETPGFKRLFSTVKEKSTTSIYVFLGQGGFIFAWECGDGFGYNQIGHFKKKAGKNFDVPKQSKFSIPKLGVSVSILDNGSNGDGFIGIKAKDKRGRRVEMWYSVIVCLVNFLFKSYGTHLNTSTVGKTCFDKVHVLASKIQKLFDNIRLAMLHSSRLLRLAVVCKTIPFSTHNKPKGVPLIVISLPFSKVFFGLNGNFKFSKTVFKKEKKNMVTKKLLSLIKKFSEYTETNPHKNDISCRDITEPNKSLSVIWKRIHKQNQHIQNRSNTVRIICSYKHPTKNICIFCVMTLVYNTCKLINVYLISTGVNICAASILILTTKYVGVVTTIASCIFSLTVCLFALTIKEVVAFLSYLFAYKFNFGYKTETGLHLNSSTNQSVNVIRNTKSWSFSYLIVLFTPVGVFIFCFSYTFSFTGSTFNVKVSIHFFVVPKKYGMTIGKF